MSHLSKSDRGEVGSPVGNWGRVFLAEMHGQRKIPVQRTACSKTREDNVAGGEGGFGRDVEDEVSEVTWDHGGDSGSHSE